MYTYHREQLLKVFERLVVELQEELLQMVVRKCYLFTCTINSERE